ncbi:MAG: PilT/PilU family type 4a pilus ATPase [Firmicutes bacterium]|nr:PilT/PilU family type 4a pilus ATPase [Bacillota bacterium]
MWHEWLAEARRLGASDLHLEVGVRPLVRLTGRLVPLAGSAPLTAEELAQVVADLVPSSHRTRLETVGQTDVGIAFGDDERLRVSAFRDRGGYALTVRLLPRQVPTPEELGLPRAAVELAGRRHGLVLVTGPTGSGKTTTLASLVDKMNRERELHIVTLEDPVEYVHRSHRSLVRQREIGTDTDSFASGLRAALRQDPDVILVGEMRDAETMAIALMAAETGHLVLATLHTGDAAGAVDRVVGAFEGERQQAVRTQLAAVLVGVVAQRLLPRRGREGRVAAFEVLVATPAVRHLIREGKSHQIASAIQTGGSVGMQTMQASLRALADAGRIDPELAEVAGRGGE